MMRVGIVLAGVLAVTGMAPAAELPPVKLYAQPPATVSAQLSPDGKRLALIATYQGRQVLLVHSLEEGGKDGKIVRTEDFEILWAHWKDNEHLIASLVKSTDWVRETGYVGNFPITRLVAVDPNGEHVTMIGEPRNGFIGAALPGTINMVPTIHPQLQDTVLSLLPETPGHILQEVFDDMPSELIGPAIYSVDIATARHELVEKGDARIAHHILDRNNIARIGIGYDKREEVIYSRAGPDDEWHEIHRAAVSGDQIYQPLTFLPDNPGLFYVFGNKAGEKKPGLWTADATTGRLLDLIDGDMATGRAWVHHGVLLGYERDDDRQVFFDPVWQADYDIVSKAMKGVPVRLIDRSTDGSRSLFEVAQPHRPKVWWVLDRTVKPFNLWPAVEQYPDLPTERMAPVREVTYKARDGLDIPAYLTLPAGYKEGPIPFVVLPHDGPYACEGKEFDYRSQFLASRGWGVLRPQYRGTTCYGRDFESKGFREWGSAMQDDLTDGTHWLIDQHYADPARICIVGDSYGGYAALEGVEKEPDLYRCAAAWAPITDLIELRRDMRADLYAALKLDRLGDDRVRLEAASPDLHAESIKVPVLLMHGKEDYSVSYFQSTAMEKAMRSANKPVEAIYLAHADHWRQDYESRAAWLSALDRFLGTQLGRP